MQLGAGQNALTESNILSLDTLARRLRGSRWSTAARAVYEHEWSHGVSTFARRPHAAHLRQPLRADAAARRPARQLRIGRRGARRAASFEERERSTACPSTSSTWASVYPVLTLGFTAGDSRRAARQLRILPPRRGHPLPTRTAAAWAIRTSRCRAAASSARSPIQLLKLHEGNGTYFYDPYAFSCMNFYEFASDAWVALLLRTPLQRHPAGPHSARQETQVARSAGLQGRVGHALEGERRSVCPTRRPPLLFPARHDVGFGPLRRNGLRRREHLPPAAAWTASGVSPTAIPSPGQDVQNFAVNLSMHLKF